MPQTRTIVGSVDYDAALYIAGALEAEDPGMGRVNVGTIFGGSHSVAELGELLKAKDYEQQQIEQGFALLDKSAIPPAVLADWAKDWQILKARYGAARALAVAKIAATANNLILGPTVSDAEAEWQVVLHALTLTPGSYQKGDIQDLYNRLIAMGAKVDESHVPQPTASADIELRAFQGLDAGIKAGEATVHDAVHSDTATALAVGGLVVVGLGVLLLAIRK